MAYALFKSRKGQEDYGNHGFIPSWFEAVQLHKDHHTGFGVDLDTFHWCEWAKLARRAESMAQDDKMFDAMDSKLAQAQYEEIPQAKVQGRAALMAQAKAPTS